MHALPEEWVVLHVMNLSIKMLGGGIQHACQEVNFRVVYFIKYVFCDMITQHSICDNIMDNK
jgi:hypothetical protein